MQFITSLDKNRIERQQYCMRTWEKLADKITALQTEEDIPFLKPFFPNVDFQVCPAHLTGKELYKRPERVRIYALVQLGPGLLINSDIKIECESTYFHELWKEENRTFKVGIRWDFDGPGKPKKINAYGIDAFLITEEVKQILPDLGFVLGISVWDYWIVWHMWYEARFRIKAITDRHLLHLRHISSWNHNDTIIGGKILKEKYDITKDELDYAIQLMTNRTPKQIKEYEQTRSPRQNETTRSQKRR